MSYVLLLLLWLLCPRWLVLAVGNPTIQQAKSSCSSFSTMVCNDSPYVIHIHVCLVLLSLASPVGLTASPVFRTGAQVACA